MLTWMSSSVDRLLAELDSFAPEAPPVVNDLSEQARMTCLKSPPWSVLVSVGRTGRHPIGHPA